MRFDDRVPDPAILAFHHTSFIATSQANVSTCCRPGLFSHPVHSFHSSHDWTALLVLLPRVTLSCMPTSTAAATVPSLPPPAHRPALPPLPPAYHYRLRPTSIATALAPSPTTLPPPPPSYHLPPSPYNHRPHLLLFLACWTTTHPIVPDPAARMLLYRHSMQSVLFRDVPIFTTTATSKTIRRFDTSGSCVSLRCIQ